MPLSDLQTLRKSKLVRRIISVEFDGVADTYVLKIRALLTNGWILQIWEHKTPELRRYAYHVYENSKTVVRWDNAPHHPQVRTFPHHMHKQTGVLASPEMYVDEVLRQLGKMVRSHD